MQIDNFSDKAAAVVRQLYDVSWNITATCLIIVTVILWGIRGNVVFSDVYLIYATPPMLFLSHLFTYAFTDIALYVSFGEKDTLLKPTDAIWTVSWGSIVSFQQPIFVALVGKVILLFILVLIITETIEAHEDNIVMTRIFFQCALLGDLLTGFNMFVLFFCKAQVHNYNNGFFKGCST